ncbi:NAD(P)H-hydrate dehydratase [Vibrio sp.]|uniref:NAD(P)H-hydrate dehydratase n=1 Tax=Vibrio sp. TaxID=678 RepID=UPI003D1533B3
MTAYYFYTAQQVKQGELVAAADSGVTMYSLMERAGQAVFHQLSRYPTARRLLVCCGGGNNGGDGYIVAALALKSGYQVTLWHQGSLDNVKGDAKTAMQAYLDLGGTIQSPEAQVIEQDIIVDGLLGTGLAGEVRPDMVRLIETLNQSRLPVIAIDVPSGLCADTGSNLGAVVAADHTVSFIGLKQGLVTGQARQFVGQLHFDGLGVCEAFNKHNQAPVISLTKLERYAVSRNRVSHKGSHGRALLIGGGSGMGGALMLASEACLRTGAGLTAALTHPENCSPLLARTPEVMVASWANTPLVKQRFNWANAIGIGPGLGQSETAQQLYQQVSDSDIYKVFDADALIMLANKPNVDQKRVITPHPGEAARLLNCSAAEVEADRYLATRELQAKFGGVVVLKGAGTIVCDGKQSYVCLAGNPGMASGGMGDVLTGVITSLIAQGLPLSQAAQWGTLLHSQAADLAAESGEKGLIASDLAQPLRRLLNE